MGTIPSLFQENPPAFHLGFTHFPGQIRDHPLVLRRKIGYNETSFRRVCRRYHNENKPVARLWRNQMDNSDWRRIGDQISDTVSRALSSREFREIQGTIQNTVHERIQRLCPADAARPSAGCTAPQNEDPGAWPDGGYAFAGVRGHRVRRCRLDRPDLQRFGADFRPYPAFYGAGNRGVSAPSGRIRRHDAGRRRAPPASTAISALSGGAGGQRLLPGRRSGLRGGQEAPLCREGSAPYDWAGPLPRRPCRRRGHLPDAGRRDLPLLSRSPAKTGRKKKTAPETTAPSDEAQSVIAEGRRLLDRIRACNDEIPGEAISRSLDRLDEVAAAIFAYVEAHPAKLPEIRRFLNYYLPTTLRLLEAYKSFSGQPVQGKHLDETRAQIEGTVDTVVQAFSNLLDGLMQDDMRDVSADMTVMKSLMEQEGLTGGFPRPKP